MPGIQPISETALLRCPAALRNEKALNCRQFNFATVHVMTVVVATMCVHSFLGLCSASSDLIVRANMGSRESVRLFSRLHFCSGYLTRCMHAWSLCTHSMSASFAASCLVQADEGFTLKWNLWARHAETVTVTSVSLGK